MTDSMCICVSSGEKNPYVLYDDYVLCMGDYTLPYGYYMHTYYDYALNYDNCALLITITLFVLPLRITYCDYALRITYYDCALCMAITHYVMMVKHYLLRLRFSYYH